MFEEGSHTKFSEPFYAKAAYNVSAASEETIVDHVNRLLVKQKIVAIDESIEVKFTNIKVAIDNNGVCHLS